jgi:hypothetical protein
MRIKKPQNTADANSMERATAIGRDYNTCSRMWPPVVPMISMFLGRVCIARS